MTFQVVTGGAGFIGSHLVERLLRDGEEVLLIDDFSSGTEANIQEFRGHPKLRVERESVTEPATLARLFKGAEFVFHHAAIPSVQKSLEHPMESNNANIGGTLAVMVAARQSNVRRVIYASSSSVYGDAEVLPKHEEMPARPLSPYALQKYSGEVYGQIFFDLFGTGFTALRYFNVFGPRQNPKSQYAAVIPRFITAMVKNEQPVIYGDGEQSRDFTYVDNVVEANIKASRSKNADGQVMNIALGERISLNQLVSTINDLLGTQLRPLYEPRRAGDVRHSQASIERSRRLISFTPVVDFKTGLQRSVQWYTQFCK